MQATQCFTLKVNGRPFAVDTSRDQELLGLTLAQFLRTRTPFTGTKISCAEGGCGACTVTIDSVNPSTGIRRVQPTNACLAPLMGLAGCSVTTNDSVVATAAAPSSPAAGWAPPTVEEIQRRLAEHSGTQCGYCSSGMVMALFAFLRGRGQRGATCAEIESMLDGNLCRCTGYRPILDAFKSFATDAPPVPGRAPRVLPLCVKEGCCRCVTAGAIPAGDADIEDGLCALALEKSRRRVHVADGQKEASPVNPQGTQQWVEARSVAEAAAWMTRYAGLRTMLVAGGTSRAFSWPDADVFIDLSSAPDLSAVTQTPAGGLTIGAAVTIADSIAALENAVPPHAGAGNHIPMVIGHLRRVASTQIRARASLAGNLVLVHGDPAFQSDVAVVLLGLGALVTYVDAVAPDIRLTVPLEGFFALDLEGKIVTSVTIPWAGAGEVFQSYKIATRQTLDHAIVNAAMRAVVDASGGRVTVRPSPTDANGLPTVAINGVNSRLSRFPVVEKALIGADLSDAAQVAGLCRLLEKFLVANVNRSHPKAVYRVHAAVNYFYRFIIHAVFAVDSKSLPPDLVTATLPWLTRPVSTASQKFDPAPQREWPVGKAIPKMDGEMQTSGRAQYTSDIPVPRDAVFAALVQTGVANAPITGVGAPTVGRAGVVAVLDASTLTPVQNSWMFAGDRVGVLFADGFSDFAGQNVALVVAETQVQATEAARQMEASITYGPQREPPVITPRDGMAKGRQLPGGELMVVRPGSNMEAGFKEAAHVVSGTLDLGSQYHFHLENHVAAAEWVEGTLMIDIAAQGATIIQAQAARTCDLPQSAVQVRTRRCGGGFGGKILAPSATGAMAGLAAQRTARPVRFETTLQDPMRAFGCRPQYFVEYKVGVSRTGFLTAIDVSFHMAVGQTGASAMGEALSLVGNADNAYMCPNFTVKAVLYRTDVQTSASVRGPGWIQAIVSSELIINSVALKCGMDPDALRIANMYKPGDVTPCGGPIASHNARQMWEQLRQQADYDKRILVAAKFNSVNRFVKRGLAMSMCRFGVAWGPTFNAYVAILPDGTIAITHGGTEIGQGINTKVAQVAALKLQLTEADLKNIKIQPTTTQVCANSGNVTGSSTTSELCALAVMNGCDTLAGKLMPFRREGVAWVDIVTAALKAGVDLTASATNGQVRQAKASRYSSWGVVATEVEVDCLTGQFELLRTDLIFDCGVSMNPTVDIGQVEGGFTMGLGWFTSEEVEWDSKTGRAVNAGTWNYKPPGAHDIPENLNITLLPNSSNPLGVLSSKAVGEPPVALAASVPLAIRNAVNAYRTASSAATPFDLTRLPMTVDKIASACGITVDTLSP